MKRGLMLIDRGSREREVEEELEIICEKVKEKGNYDFTEFCFLEVVPPFIEDGMEKCLKKDVEQMTIVPYFLYPGKKVKIAVADAMKYQKDTKIKFLVSKPMTMHRTLVDLVDSRIVSALKENDVVGLAELAKEISKTIEYFEKEELASISTPNPSKTVQTFEGTASVSEAAAIKSSGGELVVEKQKFPPNLTIAIARIQN